MDPSVPINDFTPDISNEEVVKVNETEVSSDQTLTGMKMTHQIHCSKVSLKLPYVIYNLDTHKSIYIQKGTVVAYTNKNEPEVHCFEISEMYKEAQEAIQYRNHLPNHPTLPVPLKSDMICSPAEVKFQRRVELRITMHQQRQRRGLKNSVNNFLKCFQQTMRTSAEPTSSP